MMMAFLESMFFYFNFSIEFVAYEAKCHFQHKVL